MWAMILAVSTCVVVISCVDLTNEFFQRTKVIKMVMVQVITLFFDAAQKWQYLLQTHTLQAQKFEFVPESNNGITANYDLSVDSRCF